MKPIQITIDDSLLKDIDRHLKGQRRKRAAFIRECVRRELDRQRVRAMEEAEREAYRRKPIRKGEFDVWERVQVWGDE